MEYFLHSSPLLQKKLGLIAKHSSIVKITPTTICTPTIQIRVPTFCNFSAAMEASDLLELSKTQVTISIEGGNIRYIFTLTTPSSTAKITRTIKLRDIVCEMDMKSPCSSVKIPKFDVLSGNEGVLAFKDGKLSFESHGYLKTGVFVSAELLSGNSEFSCKILGKDMSIMNDLDGDVVINFHGSHIVLYGLEEESEIAVLIRILN